MWKRGTLNGYEKGVERGPLRAGYTSTQGVTKYGNGHDIPGQQFLNVPVDILISGHHRYIQPCEKIKRNLSYWPTLQRDTMKEQLKEQNWVRFEQYVSSIWNTYLSKCSSRYFPNRLELSFFTVFALPKDSRSGVASIICNVIISWKITWVGQNWRPSIQYKISLIWVSVVNILPVQL
jgi:hypothetical protein